MSGVVTCTKIQRHSLSISRFKAVLLSHILIVSVDGKFRCAKISLIIVSAVLNKFRQQSTVIFQFAPFKQPNTFIRNLKDHGTTAPASLIFRHFPSTEYHIVSIIHLAA